MKIEVVNNECQRTGFIDKELYVYRDHLYVCDKDELIDLDSRVVYKPSNNVAVAAVYQRVVVKSISVDLLRSLHTIRSAWSIAPANVGAGEVLVVHSMDVTCCAFAVGPVGCCRFVVIGETGQVLESNLPNPVSGLLLSSDFLTITVEPKV